MNSWRDQGEGARQLWERDTCALAHDITIEEVGDGHARLRMPVRSDMANGHGICHGGIIFPHSARPGEVLLASCTRIYQQGRSSLYDTTVTTDGGESVALFRGQVIQRRNSE